MNDHQFLLHAFKGNAAAADFVMLLVDIAHTWDDLIDKDKEIDSKAINRAFLNALITIPQNDFYRANCLDLLPVMTVGIHNWLIANNYEREQDKELHVIGHVLRYSVADVATYIAVLMGGHEWAESVAPELRRRSQRDTLENYLSEIRGTPWAS